MKVFMTGGTGFVGTTLTRALTAEGFRVSILTRSAKNKDVLPQGASLVEGDPTRPGSWQDRVGEHGIIINLAGASIFNRWSRPYKKVIHESRVLTTRNLVDALRVRKGKDTFFLSTSAVGYYGFHGSEELDEESPAGVDFLASVTRDWEASAFEAEKFGFRVASCRFGIVLGRQGGAMGKMLPVFKRWLGSPLGSGKQWFSWIHEVDLARVYLFLLKRKDVSGPINCTAPYPVQNREVTRVLGKVLNKPTFLPPVPAFLVKIMMGEFGSVLLEGQKVCPKRLLNMGFEFAFPELNGALEDLFEK